MQLVDPKEILGAHFRLVLAEKRPAEPAKGFVPMYIWDIKPLNGDEKMGELKLKVGDLPEYTGHIGYRVFPDFRGQRVAAQACRMIIPLARQLGINPLRITCREENIASRRSAERAGATFAGMVEMPEGYEDFIGPVKAKCNYLLYTEEDQDN